MNSAVVFGIFVVILGYHASFALDPFDNFLESAKKAVQSSADKAVHIYKDITSDEHPEKVKEAEVETTTEEVSRIVDGCDEKSRNEQTTQCEAIYDVESNVAMDMVEEPERTETLCCTLEAMEKCSLHALDATGCEREKPALRENLKAARLFLSVLSNVSCAAYRGQCEDSFSSGSEVVPSYVMLPLFAVLFLLF